MHCSLEKSQQVRAGKKKKKKEKSTIQKRRRNNQMNPNTHLDETKHEDAICHVTKEGLS